MPVVHSAASSGISEEFAGHVARQVCEAHFALWPRAAPHPAEGSRVVDIFEFVRGREGGCSTGTLPVHRIGECAAFQERLDGKKGRKGTYLVCSLFFIMFLPFVASRRPLTPKSRLLPGPSKVDGHGGETMTETCKIWSQEEQSHIFRHVQAFGYAVHAVEGRKLILGGVEHHGCKGLGACPMPNGQHAICDVIPGTSAKRDRVTSCFKGVHSRIFLNWDGRVPDGTMDANGHGAGASTFPPRAQPASAKWSTIHSPQFAAHSRCGALKWSWQGGRSVQTTSEEGARSRFMPGRARCFFACSGAS